jgi:uncharacterized protein (DUF362 family)
MTVVDTVIGVYHFLGDRTPRNVPEVDPKPPLVNPWRKGNKAVVARVAGKGNIRDYVSAVSALLGNIQKVFASGDNVLVKPSFNSPDPFPAATDLAFLEAVIELILETGARVTIGESSGAVWRPSKNVFRKLGVPELAGKLGVGLIAFEDRPRDWVRIMIHGDYLDSVVMPRAAYEADRLVYLPCMKTHRLAWFSGAMKLAFGFVAPGQRRSFHLGNLQQKLAEVNMCWQPDLIIMDGRKAFVTGGPDSGRVVEPGIMLASGDLIGTDIEAMKVLLSYPASNKLPADPWQLPQVVTALKHNIGAVKDGYVVLDNSSSTTPSM